MDKYNRIFNEALQEGLKDEYRPASETGEQEETEEEAVKQYRNPWQFEDTIVCSISDEEMTKLLGISEETVNEEEEEK